MDRLKLFIPLALFLVLVGLLAFNMHRDPNAMPSALVDKQVPAFNLPTLEEGRGTVSEAVFEGEVTLFNVWATWCISCRVEHPFLNELKAEGVRIVGLNYRDDVAEAKQWLEKLHDPYLFSVVDADGRLGIDLGVYGAPETYFVDRRGVVRKRHVGVIDKENWKTKLEPFYRQLLSEQ